MARTDLSSSSSKSPSTPKKTSGGGVDKNQMIKLVVSLVVIVAAIGWILYAMDIVSFGGGAPTQPDVTSEQEADFLRQQEEQKNPPPGAPKVQPAGA